MASRLFDPVRKRWVTATPEEYVRQQVIAFLHLQRGYPLELMAVETSIALNGLTKRCDIVVYNLDMKPFLIVECKQPAVPITQKVADQASRYNSVLKVPYLFLTNGRQHLVLSVDDVNKRLTQVPSIPSWDDLNLSCQKK